MREQDVPPPEGPKKRRQEGEQTHLREDAGVEGGMLEEDERVVGSRKNVGRRESGAGQKKSLLQRLKESLTGR